MRERAGYRENLQDILEFFGGRRLLSVRDVCAYTGIKDYRTAQKKFPFSENRISACTLANVMAGGDAQ